MKSKKFAAILGIFLAFLVLELFFRFDSIDYSLRRMLLPIFGVNTAVCREPDSKLHHQLEKKCEGRIYNQDFDLTFKTNSLGLRNPEISLEKPDGKYRILVLGDSFTEGWGVRDEEVYSRILEEKLNEDGQGNYEVINAGVGSYSTLLEFQYLVNEGVKLEPDMVIMMVSVTDVHDDFYYGGWPKFEQLKRDNFPEFQGELEKFPELSVFNGGLISRSKLVSFVFSKFRSNFDTRSERFSEFNLRENKTLNVEGTSLENYDKIYNLTLSTVFLTKEYLENKGIDFLVTTDSRGIYHDGNAWVPGRVAWGFKAGKTYNPDTIEVLSESFRNLEIGYFDLFSVLNTVESDLLYFPYDGHWNAKAHKIVGEALAEFLEENYEN